MNVDKNQISSIEENIKRLAPNIDSKINFDFIKNLNIDRVKMI